MKIAFVGDSFCAHHGPGTPVGEDFELGLELGKKYGLDIDQYNVRSDDFDQYDWPDLVTKHFNAIPTNCGIQGVNFYHSFEMFLRKTRDEDYIIFCVTEPYRIINKYKLTINTFCIDEIVPLTDRGMLVLDWSVGGPDKLRHKGLNKEQIMDIAVNAKNYGRTIVDEDAAIVMHHALLMYVDNMMVEKGKKCLWFNSFKEFKHDWMKPFVPRSGPIGDQDLFSIATDHHNPSARNHMSKDENITMSKMIVDIIESADNQLNDRWQPGKFSMDKWFPVVDKDKDIIDGFIYP